MWLDNLFLVPVIFSVVLLVLGAGLAWDHAAGSDAAQTGGQAGPQNSSDDVGLTLAVRRDSSL
jgi:hypothetical protein